MVINSGCKLLNDVRSPITKDENPSSLVSSAPTGDRSQTWR
ncbi:hypothetical protein [Calothrix sp. NIES-2100]